MCAPAIAPELMKNVKSVSVALLYRGGADSEPPSGHVKSMPPQLAMSSATATAVARCVCGAVLLAVHLVNAGAVP